MTSPPQQAQPYLAQAYGGIHTTIGNARADSDRDAALRVHNTGRFRTRGNRYWDELSLTGSQRERISASAHSDSIGSWKGEHRCRRNILLQ